MRDGDCTADLSPTIAAEQPIGLDLHSAQTLPLLHSATLFFEQSQDLGHVALDLFIVLLKVLDFVLESACARMQICFASVIHLVLPSFKLFPARWFEMV